MIVSVWLYVCIFLSMFTCHCVELLFACLVVCESLYRYHSVTLRNSQERQRLRHEIQENRAKEEEAKKLEAVRKHIMAFTLS